MLLQVEQLKKYYGHEPQLTKALDGISFGVGEGEFLGIMGSSGSGKTTLLNCLATVTRPTSGRVFLDGQSLADLNEKALAAYRGNKIGYLFQNFELLDNLTAAENILLPASLHNVPEPACRKRLAYLAEYLGVSDILSKFPAQLSGGEKQRIAAARSLLLDPAIVYADEPTGALDSQNAALLMEQLKEMNELEGTTILMVTHDPAAASFCKRILFIQDGKLFHEIRKDHPRESREAFYHRILEVRAKLEGGVLHVF